MHFRSKGKGPEGNPLVPSEAGRPYLNKSGMPEWKRAEEEGEGTSLLLTWAGATTNKYQHFLNYLHRLTSCATDSEMYHKLFLAIYSPVSLRNTSDGIIRGKMRELFSSFYVALKMLQVLSEAIWVKYLNLDYFCCCLHRLHHMKTFMCFASF